METTREWVKGRERREESYRKSKESWVLRFIFVFAFSGTSSLHGLGRGVLTDTHHEEKTSSPAAGLEGLEEKACSGDELRIWTGSASAWRARCSGREEPHTRRHLLAPRERASSHISTSASRAQDTRSLRLPQRSRSVSPIQTPRKARYLITLFKSPSSVSHADSESPPLERRTTEPGHQQYPSPRMQRLHRDFSDMHDGTALTAQHSPAENVPHLPRPTQSSLPPMLLEKLNFYLYLILINLNLNSHMWLVATILDSECS